MEMIYSRELGIKLANDEPHKYKDWLFSEKFEVQGNFQEFLMS
jgi:hypothetical protein